ncbi:hypothetical protein NMG60_11009006 [Bertholletia excelsa]
MASIFSFFFALCFLSAYAEPVYEDGYSVSTVLDGNALEINPHFILPRFQSSDFIVLDSQNSAFYTVSFSPSQEIGVKQMAGNGKGFLDGDLATAKFDRPKSFAVDFKGNVYVADKGNGAVRKISKSGVTTIAGNEKPGRADGHGKNASFSSDFELAFVPEMCALMICDHGNKLVRQINLKSEDCARGSESGLGAPDWTWAWALSLAVSCVLSFIIGFAVRPYITAREGSLAHLLFNKTWRLYPTYQMRPILMLCSDVRSGVVSSTAYRLLRQIITLSLSQLSLMFRIQTIEPQMHEKPVSLLDSDVLGSKEMIKPIKPQHEMYAEQLKDLICVCGGEEVPQGPSHTISEGEDDKHYILCEGHQKIDTMIQANVMGFAQNVSVTSSSGLVKRG